MGLARRCHAAACFLPFDCVKIHRFHETIHIAISPATQVAEVGSPGVQVRFDDLMGAFGRRLPQLSRPKCASNFFEFPLLVVRPRSA